jgi:hypothetical protein
MEESDEDSTGSARHIQAMLRTLLLAKGAYGICPTDLLAKGRNPRPTFINPWVYIIWASEYKPLGVYIPPFFYIYIRGARIY